MNFSIKQLNSEIKAKGYAVELVKGNGYFYFADTGEDSVCAGMYSTSIYVCHFNQADAKFWREQAERFIAAYDAEKRGERQKAF